MSQICKTSNFYAHDHLSSTRGLYDSGENLVGEQEFTPYGTMYLDGMPNETMAFTGHQFDPLTGDYYAPYRYYSPTLARWLKRDPLGMVDGPNMYAYAISNPVNRLDIYGLDVWLEGPSSDRWNVEPRPHQSLSVGDPFGQYTSYSFGLSNWTGYGEVYYDTTKGGRIIKYLDTTPEQDEIIREWLDSWVGTGELYGPENCRTYSQNWFNKIQEVFELEPTTPPEREITDDYRPWWKKAYELVFGAPFTTTSSSGTWTSR